MVGKNIYIGTGLLSGSALALVFGAVTGSIPVSVLPRVSDRIITVIPHLNAVISIGAIASISIGWYSIRQGNVRRHRAAMLTSLGLFTTFLGLYLYRVSLIGPTQFPGTETVYHFVYLPILGVHIGLAIMCIPLLSYVALVGITQPVTTIVQSNHARIGRLAAPLWLVSFGLGTVVYLFLYGIN